jgi:hypothetical protein
MFYGFDAAFVGDTNTGGLGTLPVDWFFLLVSVTSGTPITSCPCLSFGQFIPDAGLGGLVDDITGYQNQIGALVAQRNSYSHPNIGMVTEAIPLEQMLQPRDTIAQSMLSMDEPALDTAVPKRRRVPWPAFLTRFCCLIKDWVPNMRLLLPPGAISGMESWLTDLNGSVPSIYIGIGIGCIGYLSTNVNWVTTYSSWHKSPTSTTAR